MAHYEPGIALFETGDGKAATGLFEIVASKMPKFADAASGAVLSPPQQAADDLPRCTDLRGQRDQVVADGDVGVGPVSQEKPADPGHAGSGVASDDVAPWVDPPGLGRRSSGVIEGSRLNSPSQAAYISYEGGLRT